MKKTLFVLLLIALNGCTKENIISEANIIVCDGDSRTAGYTGTVFWKYSDHLKMNPSYIIYNTSSGGATLTDNEKENVRWISKDALNVVDSKYSTFAKHNICIIWAGFNDMAVYDRNAIETYEALEGYCLARENQGFKVIIITEPSFWGVGETRRLELNELVRNHYKAFADGLVDLGKNPYLGEVGCYANKKYFFDGVHMTAEGYQLVVDELLPQINEIIK